MLVSWYTPTVRHHPSAWVFTAVHLILNLLCLATPHIHVPPHYPSSFRAVILRNERAWASWVLT